MADLSLRPAGPGELERVRRTYLDWGYGGGANDEDSVLLAEREGEIVAMVRRTQESGTVMLRGMQVRGADRGQRIGTRLLDAFVAGLGEEECWCVPYAHLVEFYGRAGFEVVSPGGAPPFLAERLSRYRAQGLDVTLMRRPPSS